MQVSNLSRLSARIDGENREIVRVRALVGGELEEVLLPAARWESLPDWPTGRWGPGMAGLDGEIHIMGGRDPDDSFSNTDSHDVFAPGPGAYSSAADLPEETYQVDASSDGETIWAVGSDGATTPFDDLWSYEPDSWSVESAVPTPRATPGVAANGEYVAIVAGHDGEDESDVVDIYDTDAGTWDSTTYPPGAVSNPLAVIYDEYLYAGGGLVSAPGTDEFHRYDLENEGPWEQLSDLPVPGNMFTADGESGYIWLDSGSSSESEAWRYSIAHDESTQLADTPEEFNEHGGTYHGDYWYIGGGGGDDIDGDTFYRLHQPVPSSPTGVDAVFHGVNGE